MAMTITMTIVVILLLMMKHAFSRLCPGSWHQRVVSFKRLWGQIVLGLNPDTATKKLVSSFPSCKMWTIILLLLLL